MFYKNVLLVVVSLLFVGCSLMPYESEFGCKLKDNYGKCASMEQAYEEAVTGIPQGAVITPASQKKTPPVSANKKQETPVSSNEVLETEAVPEHPYPQYRNSVYRELSTLIEKPQTPMLRPPKTIRTLILSYSPGTQKQMLYMPRYVYSVIEEPDWVLGQYLHKKTELIENIVDTGSIEK